jgi:Heterokaryon incompatibility protein (HET)
MRLLRSKPGGDFELSNFNTDDIPPYAILSHTWSEGGEVTYDELVAGKGRNKAGYAKLRFCGERATKDDVSYFWVDTCCIDKRDNNELNTALNSMFRWYQRATKCYVYLSDVHVLDEVMDAQAFRITWEDAFRRSGWFTRGWTLQELLAPASVEFFSANSKQLGSKITLEQEIHEITQIPIRALRKYDLREFSIDERMSWVTKRRTTVKEDRAYCLLGIFGVFLPLIYGEGEKHALQRLKEEIQRRLGQLQSPDVTNMHKIPSMLYIMTLTIVRLTKRSLISIAISTKRILCRTRGPPPDTRREGLPVTYISTYIYLWTGGWRQDGSGSRTRISDDGKVFSVLGSLGTSYQSRDV